MADTTTRTLSIVLWSREDKEKFARALAEAMARGATRWAAIGAIDQAALGLVPRTRESVAEDKWIRARAAELRALMPAPPPALTSEARIATLEKQLLDEQVRALELEEELARHRAAPGEAATLLAVLESLIERVVERHAAAAATPAAAPRAPEPVAPPPAAAPTQAALRSLPQPPESGAGRERERLPRIGLLGVYEEQASEVAERMAKRCEVIFIERRHERSAMPRAVKLDWLVMDSKWLNHADEQRWRTAMGKRWTRCSGGITTVVRAIAEVCDALAREEVA